MADIQKLNVNSTTYDISVPWEKVTGKPSTFAPSSHTHTKSQITDFPSSMPASDVYAWAKAASKPSYTYSEVGAPMHKLLFTKSDYQHYVVLLCKIGSNTTNTNHRISGKIYTEQGGGARYQGADIDVWRSDWTNGNDSYTKFNTYGLGEGWDLVTCKYEGANWLALRHRNTQACNAYFQGTSTGMSFTAIKYYTSNTSTVNNTEINNSISVISSFDRYAWKSEIPTNTNQLTNGAGFITGITKSMVTTALGYTPPTSDTNTWRPVTNTYTGSDTSTCVSQKGTNDLYYALVNGYASSAGSVPWSGVTGKPTIFTANGQTGSDCNSIKTNGSYYVSPSSANSPGAYGEMLCMSNVDTHAQIYVPYSNGAMKFRGANNANGYYSWRTVIDDNNISSYALTSLPSHTHSYLPLSGGTLTGTLYLGDSKHYIQYYSAGKYVEMYNATGSCGISALDSGYVNVMGTGGIHASAFYQDSDERLKTFYDPIKVDLEKLKTLRKNYFKFNDKDKLEIGVSAQEIQNLYPEIVSTNDEGYLSVAYDKLSVIALKAVDELNDINNKQQKEIDDLKDQLSTIKNILKEKGIL